MQAEVKDAYWKIFDTEDLTTGPGPKLVELINARITEHGHQILRCLSIGDEVP